jgi:hypothetical protein
VTRRERDSAPLEVSKNVFQHDQVSAAYFFSIRNADRKNQPMTAPISNIMNISSERGNATSQNNSLMSTTAAF